ncbi:hypothetical protein CBY07_020305 [Salmonella enterica]|nr:phage tail fiber C-terminal domain-containing protein [Salmonella enterica]MBA3148601.1 hypothetical protein [Salmonella enterica]
MTIFKKIKHCLSGGDKSVELRLGPAEILVSDDNGVIPEQGGRILTQVIILDAPKGQIECIYRPLQVRQDGGEWEDIKGM